MSNRRKFNHIGTILQNSLEAASALGIAASHGGDFVATRAIKGLHSSLIVAEEARQMLEEAVAERSEPQEGSQ